MTCADIEQLLDAFVDTELPPAMLLEVARHAAACATCEATVREMASLHELVAGSVHQAVQELDLSRVWPRVAAGIDRADARRNWMRRLRATPVWATALAAAASVAIWVHAPQPPVASAPRAVRVATRTPPNQTYIDRLAGKGVSVRREPKAGTTIIWVNYSPTEAAR